MTTKTNRTLGFTLIEILVVIAIIAFLASLITLSLSQARIKARDARRKTDAVTLRKAMELYNTSNGSVYPNGGAVATADTAYNITALAGFLSPTYLGSIPNDPSCPTAAIGCNYQYIWRNGGNEYGIYVPFANDGGTSCMIRHGIGLATWFSSAPDCSF